MKIGKEEDRRKKMRKGRQEDREKIGGQGIEDRKTGGGRYG